MEIRDVFIGFLLGILISCWCLLFSQWFRGTKNHNRSSLGLQPPHPWPSVRSKSSLPLVPPPPIPPLDEEDLYDFSKPKRKK